MLEPREADLPVLFLVLVVLPLVTYILLGIWSETAKKKMRISTLAQLAAEEASRVDDVPLPVIVPVPSVNVMPPVPSSRIAFHECAKCFAPATTRCSKCKSVRYCSGKCQIIHWRQGHKQECPRLASCRNLSSSADSDQLRPFMENGKQAHGNVIEEPLHSDFHSDRSDISYDTLSERKFSDANKRTPNKLKNGTLRSNEDAESGDTLLAEVTSKDASSENKLGNGNFTSSFEVNRLPANVDPIYVHASTTLRNPMHQTHKITGEIRNMLKPRCITENSENGATPCEGGTNLSSENGFSSSAEALDSNSSAEDTSVVGSVMYKRPPYTLRTMTPLSQKSAEKNTKDCWSQGIERNAYMNDESRVSATCISTSTPLQNCNGASSSGQKMSSSRKSSKVHKGNLTGSTNDGNKHKMLFPYEDLVKFFQCEIWGVSPRGLLNCGNSCYANAVLQCLTCTKPLMVYLLRRSHSKNCRIRDWCLMCELEQHVSMLREGGGPLSPSRLLSNMRNIGCRMGGGNQEDAHEFLRLLVMSMQSICLEGLGGEKEVSPGLQETTLIQQIFGGRLKSKVKCLRCHLESERYEHIMDLTLEIHGWVESLEDALTQFTAPEDLDGENMYRCGRCAAYVKARKQLSVHEVPNILTIVLKRFQTGKYGKINKCVSFPDMLDMIPFVTGTADSPPLYMLYGVVVHLDTLNASFSGHYVSYVKDQQGTWFRIDDSEVQAVSLSEVMSEGAYMLFYSRSFPRPPRTYIEKAHRTQKTSRHSQHKQIEENSGKCRDNPQEGIVLTKEETYADSIGMDFSDATLSDWSLFTSSDESSFTTESTRNSFSTVDHGEASNLDPISSIFATPYYVPEYPQSNTISCKKFSPCRAQTRFFSERQGFILDSLLGNQSDDVHKGSNFKQGNVLSEEHYRL
ncbi:uncharacterized protein A4U43_C01F25640 [Asparagus officinalis]|uniref:ubiquitinyl hydrolase 1 n=1 Tax=Asparagus officinalis TaxID=4686 RepID=A0A5P1FSQ6_ASPOF|nr:ubiquitin carboxyl-terminal hydrolase 15 [Asparagus officinalis]ONK81132.1 uncharacterized protein A4U43_C01F25640 [Asparagus officinalis]